MCYGNCMFEDHMGECCIKDYDKIKELTGYNACLIGGSIKYQYDEELYKELLRDGEIDKAMKLVLENKLVW